MWNQFILENFHFALNLMSFLVLFLTSWLHFDAWQQGKNRRELFRSLGFLVLSISFLILATTIEITAIETSFFALGVINTLASLTGILGYIFIIISLLLDPLMPRPNLNALILASLPLAVGRSIASLVVALLFLRRTTIGYEKHLKPVTIGFFILALSEFLKLGYNLQTSTNIDVYRLVAPFGPLWIIQNLFQAIALFILGKWVFGYLLKRIQAQLFVIFNTTILVIFLVTSISFTFLVINNLQKETLRKLSTDASVLNYTFESKKNEILSDAEVLSLSSELISAVIKGDRNIVARVAENFLTAKKESSIIITDQNGQVIARGEDKEKFGDSLSSDSLVKRAFAGESLSSVITKDGVTAPEVYITAATPIKDSGKIIGTVIIRNIVDNTYVDGIKKATGLDASVYGDNQLSATTITYGEGRSRANGIKEESEDVKLSVLKKGESFSGATNILNIPYFGVYQPIIDVDNNPVGMLFVGLEQASVLASAVYLIELTFLTTVILLLVSVIPSYFISRYISGQVSG